ncbi:MAG: hypothetical protein QXG52_07225 [Candidatus Caldarchaeum sp.]
MFDPIMYPPSTSYKIIYVPTVPYPPETLTSPKTLLANNIGPRKNVKLGTWFLQRLKERGLISMTADKIVVTDSGRKLYDTLLKYL